MPRGAMPRNCRAVADLAPDQPNLGAWAKKSRRAPRPVFSRARKSRQSPMSLLEADSSSAQLRTAAVRTRGSCGTRSCEQRPLGRSAPAAPRRRRVARDVRAIPPGREGGVRSRKWLFTPKKHFCLTVTAIPVPKDCERSAIERNNHLVPVRYSKDCEKRQPPTVPVRSRQSPNVRSISGDSPDVPQAVAGE